MAVSDLQFMVGQNENILWQGKPNKKCFILESIFNPMLPVALIWGFFDFGFMFITGLTAGDSIGAEMIAGLGVFFLLHLMPVWIYIGGVVLSFRRYKNTEYIITDKGIYVSGGTFSYNYEMKPFTDLSHVNIHRGIWDQWLGVGDVVTVCDHLSYQSGHNHTSGGMTICDIADYQKVFTLVKQLQTDIYADTMYPNDLRPGTNSGYRTEYVGPGRNPL
ncbi:MAG: PH domain-containing protein [Bacteroidales bacterium]|nr:PH domain-containing protein [Lachnoclostridium sp.]MCM1385451.1 PH domain-containing protein [Lachnoclostridium sp.]MCM1466356.1 PH domain-containing protein [Bacteroidales bacterium]